MPNVNRGGGIRFGATKLYLGVLGGYDMAIKGTAEEIAEHAAEVSRFEEKGVQLYADLLSCGQGNFKGDKWYFDGRFDWKA